MNTEEFDFFAVYDDDYRPGRTWRCRGNVLLCLTVLNTLCLFSLIGGLGFMAVPAYEMRTFWNDHKESFVEASDALKKTQDMITSLQQIKHLLLDKLLPILCSVPYTRKYLGPEWCDQNIHMSLLHQNSKLNKFGFN